MVSFSVEGFGLIVVESRVQGYYPKNGKDRGKSDGDKVT